MKRCPICATTSKKKFRRNEIEAICGCGYHWKAPTIQTQISANATSRNI